MLDTAATFVSLTQLEYRALTTKATLGKVLGRNIERAAAAWALLFSLLLVVTTPVAPFYAPVAKLVSLPVWAWAVGVVSASRVIVLIVNGYWPITFQVRIAYSIVTLLLVWAVICGLSLMSTATRGVVFPSIALAPLAATVELLCFLSLRARLESARQGVITDVGHSAGGDRDGGEYAAAGVRQRLG